MKRKTFNFLLILAVICLTAFLQVVTVFAYETSYVISFRPGEKGVFTPQAEEYLSSFGRVSVTGTGNIFLKVPAGTAFPAEITSYLTVDEGYYYKGGLSGGTINSDETYIVRYGVLNGEATAYTVRFMDGESLRDVAPPYTGYANIGDTITFSAKAVSGYKADAEAMTLTVSDGGELIFKYTSDKADEVTEYVYGENTVITQTVAENSGRADQNNQNEDSGFSALNPDNEAGIGEKTSQNPGDNTQNPSENRPEESAERWDIPPAEDGKSNPSKAAVTAAAISGTLLGIILIAIFVNEKRGNR